MASLRYVNLEAANRNLRGKHRSICSYNCSKCRYETHWKFAIEHHMKRHQNQIESWDLFSCDIEIANLKRKTVTLETYNLSEYHCRICGLTTFSEVFLHKHLDNMCHTTLEPLLKINCHTPKYLVENYKWDSGDRGAIALNQRNFVDQTQRSCRSKSKNSYLIKRSDNSEQTWLSCLCCTYKTKFVSHLKRHVIWNHYPDHEIQWFKCKICSYRAKAKRNLQRHIHLKHAMIRDMNWCYCDLCPYKTKNQIWFNHHVTLHSNSTNFSCSECRYQAATRNGLRIHVVNKHTPENEVEWFQCPKCTFKSKKKTGVNTHLRLQHSDKVVWFKCEFCTFVTKLTRSLKTHVINKHTSDDVIKWFNCDLCPHRAKCHGALMNHKRYKHIDETKSEPQN